MKVLLVEEDQGSLAQLKGVLLEEGVEVCAATSADDVLGVFRDEHPRIVLLDLPSPEQALHTLTRILDQDPGAEVIVVGGETSAEFTLRAIREGASDYLVRPFDLQRVRAVISSLLFLAQERQRFLQLDEQLVEASQFEGMTSRSPLMMEVFSRIRRIAPHFQTVLVTGGTGTGKELVARALYRLSPVAARSFAVCNCSALVESLLETELFGYVKGAFTGAQQDKVGVFEYANGGCVFLDEIGEMPLSAQAKLLRVLQNHEVRRVGSPVVRSVDVRVIAATNRNLRSMVKEGLFREDLYYRLGLLEIALPRLADRKEDLPLLERHIVRKFADEYKKPIVGLTRRAQARLAAHSWPGNVRELENMLANACMMAQGHIIDLHDLPEYLREATAAIEEDDELLTMHEMQEQHLLRVLVSVGGNKARAAQILDIGRATVYDMLARIESRKAEKKLEGKAAGQAV
jgi:DNA-binding NtrC family response regulator